MCVTFEHPLDPLAEQDVSVTVDVLTAAGRLGETMRITRLAVEEASKQVVREFDDGARDRVERRTEVVCFDLATKQAFEAVVSVTHRRLLSWAACEDGVGPGVLDAERVEMERIIRADSRWRAAMRRRGVDPDKVHFECVAEPLSIGHPHRAARYVGFVKSTPADNYYARPIDGVVVHVDLMARDVIQIDETEEPLPIPDEPGNFDLVAVGVTRTDLLPLYIVQPEGPSFELRGHELRWQHWRMRVGFHPVEGLVLHRIAWDDDGRVRPLVYRAALSEMVVPYADSSLSQWWRAVFDAGEVGLGTCANSLELGCDCLGEIRYLDAVVADPDGTARRIANAICIHEEDFGIAWKHDGIHVATSEVRRNRRLVVSYFATVGNYDYGFYWHFYPDGSMEAEVRLTGIIYTGAVPDGTEPDHGVRVAPNLYGPHHQHLFCFRLDMEVDGERNTVEEVDAELVPTGPDNPHGNAFRAVARPLLSERQARRDADSSRSRYWRVVNPSRRNRLGQPVAYKLVPQYSPTLIADPQAHVSGVAGFGKHHLWVTAYHPAERYAAGDYPAFGDVGLEQWGDQDRPLEAADVVLWHTVGTTHIARPEDWPVMPVERVGFTLKPAGFFDRNPALDLPPPRPAHNC